MSITAPVGVAAKGILSFATLLVFTLASSILLASADTVSVRMKSGPNRYEPETVTIKVGDTVEWTNDSGTHTATPKEGQPDPFKGSPDLKPGEKYSVAIYGAPRTIEYQCEIHGPAMSGRIVVAP